MEVPDYSKELFALSGLLLTSSGDAFITPRPDAQLKDRLLAPPTATRTFTPGETITFLTDVYDGSNRSTHTVDLSATVRAASDGRIVFNMRNDRTIRAGKPPHTEEYRGEIPLRDLAPGAYVLRVEATSRMGNHFAFREVPFQVKGSVPR